MGRETSPAFQLYVKEWRSSRKVSRMTFAQRGMYLEMLLEQWDAGDLPDDCDAVRVLIGGRPSDWRGSWTTLRANFVSTSAGRMQNARLEVERVKQRKWRKRAQKGGIARAYRQTSSAKPASKQARSSATDVHSVSDRVCVSDRNCDSSVRQLFDAFWDRYPNKAGKQPALKAWKKLRPDDATIAAIHSALDWQIALPNWVKDGGGFVPHGSTYLNNRRWADEPPQVARPKTLGPVRVLETWEVECARLHESDCAGPLMHTERMKQAAAS